MKEIWKDIPGYENLYQVSNLGRIKSLNYQNKGISKILKQAKDYDGYCLVSLSKNGKHITKKVHRLVAETFLGNSALQVNHKDENKNNNTLNNLEFCTPKYNTRYSVAKKVLQIDDKGNIIKEWNCIRDIEKEMGLNHSNICSCCKGKLYNKVGGFIWKYKEMM